MSIWPAKNYWHDRCRTTRSRTVFISTQEARCQSSSGFAEGCIRLMLTNHQLAYCFRGGGTRGQVATPKNTNWFIDLGVAPGFTYLGAADLAVSRPLRALSFHCCAPTITSLAKYPISPRCSETENDTTVSFSGRRLNWMVSSIAVAIASASSSDFLTRSSSA